MSGFRGRGGGRGGYHDHGGHGGSGGRRGGRGDFQNDYRGGGRDEYREDHRMDYRGGDPRGDRGGDYAGDQRGGDYRREPRNDYRGDYGRDSRGDYRGEYGESRRDYRDDPRGNYRSNGRNDYRNDRMEYRGGPPREYRRELRGDPREQDYRGQDYRGQDYRGQDYRGQDYRGQDYRGGRGDPRSDYRGGDRGDFSRGDGDFRGGRDDFRGRHGPRGRGGPGGGPRGGGGGFRGGPRGGRGGGNGPPPGSGQGGIYLEREQPQAPDAAITALENELVPLTRDKMFPIGSGQIKVPGRRGYGTKGTPIVLRTNYLKISPGQSDMDKTWYRYDVELNPEPSKARKYRAMKELMKHDKFQGVISASDYAKIVVTTSPIDLGSGEWTDNLVIPPAERGPSNAPDDDAPNFVQQARDRNTVKFRVQSTGTFTPRHMIEYLSSNRPGAEYASAADIIQILNIITCNSLNSASGVAPVGKKRFYPLEDALGAQKYDLGGGLQAMRGYYASVRPAVGRLLLNLNVTAGAFYKPVPLLALRNDYMSNRTTYDMFEGFISKLKVRAEYIKDGSRVPYMTKIKSIVGFSRPPNAPRRGDANDVCFEIFDSENPDAQLELLSVAEYFRRHHNITLKHPDLPVLNCGTRQDPQYLPMELCSIVPGQVYLRLLGGDQTSEMLRFAARSPNLNAMSIVGTSANPGIGVQLFNLRDASGNMQDQPIKKWGFGVDACALVTVPGRILDSPQVAYRNRREFPRGGSWNCNKQTFYKGGRFGTWQVLVLNRRGGNTLHMNPMGEMRPPEMLFDDLEKTLRAYGIQTGTRLDTKFVDLDSLTVDNRKQNDSRLQRAFEDADRNEVEFLFIVLPEFDRWLYARIKYYGDIQYGIHTLDSVGSKLQKPKGQGMYLGNLALKFNIKSGGVNHTVPDIFAAPLDDNTMLMGIDVTHPSPGSRDGAPSISCVVASVDEHVTQWPGSIRAQKGFQEMVQGLEEMVGQRLEVWRKHHNGQLPTKIVLYRDGVSEGQYELVLSEELPCFEEAFSKAYGDKEEWPKMSIIVVGKRHHTRFYPTKREEADVNKIGKGSWNPLPGTIVDRHVGGRILREFWLQAHSGLQGTARPAHYVVIKDDILFEADELERLTLNLSYTFNRATKAVSVCPPAYYADLLCERGRAYLFGTLAENLGSDTNSDLGGEPEWKDGVHPRLQNSTWYI
ncbi:Piwi-domain-containing protein [Piedraia hortae CBS 480.64]|uniref:Piwi-domain-containing protein n=1 Tax=Piedraia hortae CBS 480.64 TaxID=1314780 RepID=A0A6A7C024_9PEZI|nr:Piwi-domain-containing protein [Piedraia hortae CBS 480.64]